MSDLFDFNGARAQAGPPEPMKKDAINTVPTSYARVNLPRWPRASEPISSTLHLLSQRNFGIDTGFYPLGSCTMKLNPRINERIVQFQELMGYIHYNLNQIQGLLSIYYEMQKMLAFALVWMK